MTVEHGGEKRQVLLLIEIEITFIWALIKNQITRRIKIKAIKLVGIGNHQQLLRFHPQVSVSTIGNHDLVICFPFTCFFVRQ